MVENFEDDDDEEMKRGDDDGGMKRGDDDEMKRGVDDGMERRVDDDGMKRRDDDEEMKRGVDDDGGMKRGDDDGIGRGVDDGMERRDGDGEMERGEEGCDRLPRRPIVHSFDLFCFAFGIVSHLVDVGTDLVVARHHFYHHRTWEAVCIFTLVLAPSVLLNLISFVWLMDDSRSAPKKKNEKSLWNKLKMIACLFQLGPCIWYTEALLYGIRSRSAVNDRSRRIFYARMICAERDASLLRIFEAFLESSPQIIIQGYMAGIAFWQLDRGMEMTMPRWVYLHGVSLICSLMSVCWTISVHHRCLRITRSDKANIRPGETLLQFTWRLLTVFARFLCFILFAMAFRFWLMVFCGVHYAFWLFTIALFQVPDPSAGSRFILVPLLAVIHIFAPFNVVEGHSKLRYIFAYTIEIVENVGLLMCSLLTDSFNFTYKWHVAAVSICSFSMGILMMMLYYTHCHPSKRNTSNDEDEDDLDEGKKKPLYDSQNKDEDEDDLDDGKRKPLFDSQTKDKDDLDDGKRKPLFNSRNKDEDEDDLDEGKRKPLSDSRNKDERISPGIMTKILLHDKMNGTNLDSFS